ncbi:MAG: hypothetical protein H8K06_20740 [Nitrospira sp.]|nr:hypothetical protein [Nitrospira sp.]
MTLSVLRPVKRARYLAGTPDRIKLVILVSITLMLMCGVGQSQVIRLAETKASNGAAETCRPGLTGPGGTPAWKRLLVRSQPALFETSNRKIGNRFSLCIVDAIRATDVDLTVLFMPLGGKVGRAAGLIFRVVDPNNYYAVVANALDDTVRLYRFENGAEHQLAGVDATVPAGKAQELRVRIIDELMEVFLDDKKLFEARDKTFAKSGPVGIWTKADSLTAFFELTASVLKK